MIDPHVHLRDGKQRHKETLKHGLSVAEKIGLSGVFDMPNTDPPILRRDDIICRLQAAADVKSPVFYGLYCGLGTDPDQIREAVDCVREYYRVVGLKLYAGRSTGDMSIPEAANQFKVLQVLARYHYEGVLAVHCENESDFRPELWDPAKPLSHTLARPPVSEVNSVANIIGLALEAGYKGTLHICHVSLPKSIEIIEAARESVPFRITCGVTPHHLLLCDIMMEGEAGLLLKMNPPLRSKDDRDSLLRMLLDSRIDWIESDHAPHLKSEKLGPPYASGIPGFPILPFLLKVLRMHGASESLLQRVTHDRICEVFKLFIPFRDMHDQDTFNEYDVNAYTFL
ncbi:MAG: dihydroorotase [Candidatus Marinimicrobia bacterium]|nr:dihydroorotase [Candidatus Neomarinimicrobiota bacterium]